MNKGKQTKVLIEQKFSLIFDYYNTNKPLNDFCDDFIKLCQKYDPTFKSRMNNEPKTLYNNFKYESDDEIIKLISVNL